MISEKQRVAGISVFAAIFLTGIKLVVGILTGSLGLLSESLHSGLDLVAAVITFFSVRISDSPPDKEHNFGHGKIENFSAFLETILLFITCIWIINEALHRLITGDTNIEVTTWSYVVVIISIIVDFTRSRALSKVAKKYNSQALEADALHFSTDIWSSLVVLLGLICANFGFFFADSVAALIVAFIVIVISYRLGKRSIEVLLDYAPREKLIKVEGVLNAMPEIETFHSLKVRTAGADTFVRVIVTLNPQLRMDKAHEICDKVEREICKVIERCDVFVHVEPLNQKNQPLIK
ncbi:MAG: cation diffusion facilitator family transporter [Bacteroidia bacterium]|nr:cation diffusion facilitator family transporter [Bacteroidia bacterium]